MCILSLTYLRRGGLLSYPNGQLVRVGYAGWFVVGGNGPLCLPQPPCGIESAAMDSAHDGLEIELWP